MEESEKLDRIFEASMKLKVHFEAGMKLTPYVADHKLSLLILQNR